MIVHHELTEAAGGQAQVAVGLGRLHARRPDDQVSGNFAFRCIQAIGVDGVNLGVGQQAHPLFLEGMGGLGGDPFGQAAKDIEGRMPGCLFGNLALEMSTRDDVMRAKLNAALAETPEEAENRIGQADDRRRAADHRSTESIDEQKAQNEGIE